MGAQEDRRDTGESGGEGEGLKEDWSVDLGDKNDGMKGAKRNKKMEKKGEVLNENTLISGSFTHSWPSFPFPPIISTSSYSVLGRVGGVFFCVR